MGALRRAYFLSAANAARPLDEAISPAPPFHQRETLVWRQQSRARWRVRYAARTRRRRKKSHHPQSLFLKRGRPGPSWRSRFHDDGNGIAAVLYRDMADGQVVLVTTEPLGGGSPVRSVYFVAEQDPEAAKAIIDAMTAPNEKVEAWGRLPEAAVKALGLKRGDFTHG